MKNWITSLVLTGAAAAALGGCADDTPELYIQQNGIPDDECLTASTGGSAFRSRGVLDLLITNQYVMFPLVENSLVSSESVSFGGGGGEGLSGNEWEANAITLRRAEVSFDAPDALGVPLPRSVEIPISGTAQPGDLISASLLVVSPQIGSALRRSTFLRDSNSSIDLLVRLKFFGVTGGGREIDSNEFIYPITLCFGCLLSVPPEAVDPSLPAPNCRNTADFNSETADLACFPGQDSPLDCRFFCPIFGEDEDPTGICIPN